jgi:hypothetical protein
MGTVTFRSKIDAWLLIVLVAASAVAVLSAGALLAVTGGGGAWLLAIAIVLLGAGLPLWVLLSTRYTLTASELRVASGPFAWRVPLADIKAVTPTRNPLSSPALSLDRLRIDYAQGRWLMVSPGEKEGFLRELHARRAAAG